MPCEVDGAGLSDFSSNIKIDIIIGIIGII